MPNRSLVGIVASLSLLSACGGESAPALAPAGAAADPPPALPAPTSSTPAPAPAPAPRAPVIPTEPIDLVRLAPVQIALGTPENPTLPGGLGGAVQCLLSTVRAPATVLAVVPAGTRVDRVVLRSPRERGAQRIAEMDVIADGEPIGTATAVEGAAEHPIGRVVRRLELRPRARDSTVCVTGLELIGVPGVPPYSEPRVPVASALPLLDGDDVRLTLVGDAPLSAAEADRAPFAALRFAHGADKTVTYEIALVRGRDDRTGATLIPPPSEDPQAPAPVVWTDVPGPRPSTYGWICRGEQRRVVLRREETGPTGRDRAERTLFRVCGLVSSSLTARDVDGDGRLELEVRVRHSDSPRSVEELLIVDTETFFTELSSGFAMVPAESTDVWHSVRALPDGALVLDIHARDAHGVESPLEHRSYSYDPAVDGYRVLDQTRDPSPWEVRDPTEHILLHALRELFRDARDADGTALAEVRLPGTASAPTERIVLALLDAAVARAIPALERAGYAVESGALAELGRIRSARDAGRIGEIVAERRAAYARHCSSADTDPTDCEVTPPFDIADIARAAFATPFDDAAARAFVHAIRDSGLLSCEPGGSDGEEPDCDPPPAWTLAVSAARGS